MQPEGYKHFTKWSFGDHVYHKTTGDKGMIVGIQLRHQSEPRYLMVFENSRVEDSCLQFELTEEQPAIKT